MAMDQRLLGWGTAGGSEDETFESGRLSGALLPTVQVGDDEPEEDHLFDDDAPSGPRLAQAVPRIRPLHDPPGMEVQGPDAVDRRDMQRELNDALQIDPRRTAVITIDCQRSHLDLAVATMPVAPQAAASMVLSTARLLRLARALRMSVVHVLSQNRILPMGQPEALCNPFWAAVERSGHGLMPDRESALGRHNLVGTVQTQLMPELGPEPGDMVIDRKRRMSIYRDTDLDLTLRELGADTVVLAGIDTSTSVLCAAFESVNRDLRAVVVSDCVQSLYGDDLHTFGLQNVARCLGWVLTLDELAAKVDSAHALSAR
jgi:nicotinamidase-related amidase